MEIVVLVIAVFFGLLLLKKVAGAVIKIAFIALLAFLAYKLLF